MTDFLLLEQLCKKIKEITRPKLAFRKSVTAKGFFRPYMSLAEYTKASIFDNVDNITPVTVRFSAFLGDVGTADTVRNVKNMDIKFYFNKGEYDVICQNIPVNLIDNKAQLMDAIDIFTCRYYFDSINRNKFWDFIAENPKALEYAIHLYSYEGLSDSFINRKQYSVNKMIWENNSGIKTTVKYVWVPLEENLDNNRNKSITINKNSAEFIAGFDPNIAVSELIDNITNKKFPKFELQIKMITGPYVHSVAAGIMTLNYIKEISTSEKEECYAPGNLIEGIELFRSDLVDIMDFVSRIQALER